MSFMETMTASNVLDAVIMELKNRFAGKNLDIMRSIQCCNPESLHFLDFNYLTALAEVYT